MTVRLTDPQKSLLLSDLQKGNFILLQTTAQDRVAKNLSDKRLGYFVSHRSQYSWRRRDGYFNLFYLNEKGLGVRNDLKS